MNPAAWQLASSVVAVGLGWKESLMITAVSYFVIAVSLSELKRCPRSIELIPMVEC